MSVARSFSLRLLRTQPDGRLVELARQGQDDAFAEIVRRYRSPLVAFAAAIVPRAIAEEVVQSAFARAHQRLRADSREIRLRPWLFTIVRNGALNAYAAERPHAQLGETLRGGVDPADAAVAGEEFERVIGGIMALPAKQREALVRREVEGEGYAEIAAALMTTPTAARGLIFRARNALRESLGMLVPLPILHAALASGTAAVPTGAAGLGAGLGTKAAVTAAATVIAFGGGVAIQGGGVGGGSSPARAAGDGGPPSDEPPGPSVAAVLAKEEDVGTVEEVEEDDEEGPDTGSRGGGGSRNTRDGSGGDRGGAGGGGNSGPEQTGGGSDGPGGGDSSGSGSGGEDTGGSGSVGSSGPGGDFEEQASDETSSGSGSGGPGPSDSSGSGSSGSGGGDPDTEVRAATGG